MPFRGLTFFHFTIMPTSSAAIVAELSTKAECDQFTTFLNQDRAQAAFQQSNLSYTITNFGSPASRTAEIGRLTDKIAAAATELAQLPEGPDKLQHKAAMQRDELRLTNLQTKSYTQGGDNKAEKLFDRDSCEDCIARADVLLPLVVARKAALPS